MSRDLLIEHLKTIRKDIDADQDVVVELFRPEDARGVSLAYYEIYGDFFPIEHVYDPEEVVRRNATDDQYTVIARTSRGEVVGLVGLFRHAPNQEVYEAGQLMVYKGYRNGEIAKRMGALVLGDLPEKLDLPVIFAEAVCNHPAAQKLLYNRGLRSTGLALECMPAGAYSREGGVARNVSLLLMFIVRKDQLKHVYLPAIYAEHIQEIYEDQGLLRDEMRGGDLMGATESDQLLMTDINFVRVTVKKAGEDLGQVVAASEEQIGSSGLVQVYINLGDQAAHVAVTLLRQRGYFFGGLLPCWFGSDGLLMQKLPQQPDWDGVRLRYKESRRLLEYIRKDYEAVTR